MVTNVSSLLKTVKSVEDKALRGTRALESTTDAVKQAVLVSLSIDTPLPSSRNPFTTRDSYQL